jgi:hypothetical protein
VSDSAAYERTIQESYRTAQKFRLANSDGQVVWWIDRRCVMARTESGPIRVTGHTLKTFQATIDRSEMIPVQQEESDNA